MSPRINKPAAIRLLVAGVLVSAPVAAEAFDVAVNFCNRTPEAVYVAVGAEYSGTSETTSRGWNKVVPCTCRTVLNANLRATEIFLLAAREGLDNVLSDERAGLCVHPHDQFRYTTANASRSRCEQAGGQWAIFKMVDTGGQDYKFNLRRQGACNMMGD